jgi:hypothetical protein
LQQEEYNACYYDPQDFKILLMIGYEDLLQFNIGTTFAIKKFVKKIDNEVCLFFK